MRPHARRGIALFLLSALAAFVPSARAFDFALLSNDAVQPYSNPQDNYETVLSGNQTAALTGPFTTPFPSANPTTVSFNSGMNQTTISYSGSGIPTNSGSFFNFGYTFNAQFVFGGISTVRPMIKDHFWTRFSGDSGSTPEVDTSFAYNPATRTATISYSNDPADFFALSDVGFLVTTTPFTLNDLNRSVLGPGAFDPSGIANGTVLGPGDSISYNITNVALGDWVTVFTDSQFTGASASNPYGTNLSGHWAMFHAVPEPGSFALLGLGVIGITRFARRGRRRTIAPRRA